MGKRRFTRSEKWTAWLAQDGKSAISGQPLGPDFHADHRLPWAKGGETSIENCDAVTAEENWKKGTKMNLNRFAWQDEFIQKYMHHTEPNFFLCALPGAGKTRASIRVMRMWLDEGGAVVVVVPTIPIKRNWRDKAREVGINLDENFYGFLREKYHGVLTTYQAISTQCNAFRKFCQDRPVLLICDEIHHASEGDNSAWGVALGEAFRLAKRRLLLSGTPVRTDKETTSFLKIVPFTDEDGNSGNEYEKHFEYDWPRALEDGVVRYLTFPRIEMSHVNVNYVGKGAQTFSNDDERWLNYALDENKFLLAVLRAANRKLDELRMTDPSAAGLAVAKHIGHAREIYKLLEILGQQPVIVTSDTEEQEEHSVDIIRNFESDFSKRWMVAVRQISEGVDIPRLRVEAYLTNYATDLAFRQLVGRVVRRRESDDDDGAQAWVFIPETPKLAKLAEKIERWQRWVAKKPKNGNEGGVPPERGYTTGGTEPEFIGYIIRGKHYTGDRMSMIEMLMKKYRVTERSAALMVDDPNFAQGIKIGESTEELGKIEEQPPWVEEEVLRSECNDLVKQLTKVRQRRRGHGEAYNRAVWEQITKEVQIEFMIDRTPQKELSISQLQRKKAKLLEAIMREEQF